MSSCICGQCIDDWYSPRMRRALIYAGQDIVVAKTIDILKYLPQNSPPIEDNLAFMGLSQIFAVFYSMLQSDTKSTPPSAQLLHDTLHSKDQAKPIKKFFELGGSAGLAVKVFLDVAKEQSVVGEPPHAASFEVAHKADASYLALPVCNNDYDFELAKMKLGLENHYSRSEELDEVGNIDGHIPTTFDRSGEEMLAEAARG
ncbi:hypothetical protein CYLTODRAFT_489047 [Cylindrobasidium torrendii FP15055 ss-10]|uniref:Uncharacterized protein n=1 Tax=Cylindrobasidium torrendii FP15055 ss-10 TaxID=1314674 RepID=A0A0D7BGN8_9AGAR|nr:hypothetical protein CYLTODRAFT_489047 [Cylindrobasidium torrendii FP15055 ss-10]